MFGHANKIPYSAAPSPAITMFQDHSPAVQQLVLDCQTPYQDAQDAAELAGATEQEALAAAWVARDAFIKERVGHLIGGLGNLAGLPGPLFWPMLDQLLAENASDCNTQEDIQAILQKTILHPEEATL